MFRAMVGDWGSEANSRGTPGLLVQFSGHEPSLWKLPGRWAVKGTGFSVWKRIGFSHSIFPPLLLHEACMPYSRPVDFCTRAT